MDQLDLPQPQEPAPSSVEGAIERRWRARDSTRWSSHGLDGLLPALLVEDACSVDVLEHHLTLCRSPITRVSFGSGLNPIEPAQKIRGRIA